MRQFENSDTDCNSAVFDNLCEDLDGWSTMKSQHSGKEAFYYEDEDSGLGMDELEISFNSSCSSLVDQREPLEQKMTPTPPRNLRGNDSGCDVTCPSSPLYDSISAVDIRSLDSNLVADGTRSKRLPTISGGKHKDLSAITRQTMAEVIDGHYAELIDHVTIIDCRYPYEYEGGHINCAVNLYTKDSIQDFLNDTPVAPRNTHVLIFHCEFSLERGPKMHRFLRSLDRELNTDKLPQTELPGNVPARRRI